MATDIGLIRAVSASFPKYVDYAAGAKTYIDQWYAEKKLDAEKMRREAAAYKLAEQKRAADQEKFYSKFKDLDKSKQFPYLNGYNQVMAATSKNMAYNAAKMDPGFGRQEIMNRAQQGINQAAEINQEWKEYIADVADRDSEYSIDEQGNYIRKEDTKSNINDAFTYEFDRKRTAGEFKTSIGEDGKPVYIFDKKDFDQISLETEGGKKAFADGNQIIVPHDEIFKIYSIKEKQTKRYVSAIDSLEANLPKLLSRGYDTNNVNSLIDETIDNLKLTDDEALSIAVDELGLLPKEYAGSLTQYFDQNKDGSVIDELLPKIKEEFKKVINTPLQRELQAQNRKTAISEAKDEDNTSENIATAGIEDIEKALTDFNFSILNGKTINGRKVENTEIKNGKLIINYVARTTSEGQQIAESEPIDLNDQMAIKNLAGEYLKSIYGSDKTVDQAILSLRNKEIKTIEKAAQEKSILFPSPTTKPQLP